MPKTKSSRKYNPSLMERYKKIDNEVDKEIFFQYYLGYKSGGSQGYDMVNYNPGAAHHRKNGVGKVYTDDQFRRKAKKLALLAMAFLATANNPDPEAEEIIPPLEEMPVFTEEDLDYMIESRKDKRTPMEKFVDLLAGKDWEEYFIFFAYYDGWKAHRAVGDVSEVIGFNPNLGGNGSVNHKNAFTRLDHMSASTFREKGKKLGDLAIEFLDKNVPAPAEYRPIDEEPELLHDMIEECTRALTSLDL